MEFANSPTTKRKKMIPLETIINEIVEKFKGKIISFFAGESQSICVAEKVLKEDVELCVTELLGAYYCKVDSELLSDKRGRKDAGLSVERRNDRRQILTEFGMVSYKRTYYAKREGGYCYPVDAVAGIEGYERITQNIAKELCDYSRKHSFAASSECVTKGRVSRQTVMNKLRNTELLPEKEHFKKKVSVLHIDADEDHVSLQDGSNVIAPIISVYEGIEVNGKRSNCRNIQHHTFFEKKADDMWENVLSSIEKKYDIEDTVFYIHGDGARWIKTGKDWLANAKFVLDRYHYNKTIKQVLACIEPQRRGFLSIRLKRALEDENTEELKNLRKELLTLNPQRSRDIIAGMDYLSDNMEGISIYAKDPEASNGGATEPHVSHVLSERLSMRPMGWSRETLRHLVPMLSGAEYRLIRGEYNTVPILKEKQENVRSRLRKRFGLVDTDYAIESPVIRCGQVNPLFLALKPYLR